jgi:hypothetical protein
MKYPRGSRVIYHYNDEESGRYVVVGHLAGNVTIIIIPGVLPHFNLPTAAAYIWNAAVSSVLFYE